MALGKLKPIENLTQVDKIEKALKEYFETSNMQPGDPLPKEMELAAALGVSRTAIREAISRFRTLGMIESRKNKGMVLTSPDLLGNMEKLLIPRLLTGQTMNDIFELRLILELGITDLLFLRKNKENLRLLEDIVEKEEQTTTAKDLIHLDVDFHSTLYTISGNKTVLRFQRLLTPIFNHVFKEIHAQSYPIARNTGVTHRDLLNTLKRGTEEGFRKKMKTHLTPYFEKLEQ